MGHTPRTAALTSIPSEGSDMPHELLCTFLGWTGVLSPAFTNPGFANALIIMVGWIQTRGPHAVTQALVETEVAGRRHHEAFHRFFSRGTWEPDHLGKLLFEKIVDHLLKYGVTIDLVLDDTLVVKKGAKVFGLGNHVDAVRSTAAIKALSFGHVWVVMSVVVNLPFSNRPWALPILFRLYRSKKEHAKNRGGPYFTKNELGREMLDIVYSWRPDAKFRLAADSAYSCNTLMRELPENITFVGAMRADSVLTALPTAEDRKKTGRRRKRGKVLPTPLELAKSPRQRWKKISLFIYGRKQTLEYKTVDAQWYRPAGTRLLRIVVVRVSHGVIPVRTFFSTDLSMTVAEVLETYAGRWSIEVCFRDLKQLLGFGDSQARLQTAVARTAPFVGYTYTLLVLWFSTHQTMSSTLATPPLRPWYRHKRGYSFADVLRTAQRVLSRYDVLDLARDYDDLRQPIVDPPPRPSSRETMAA
jgi:hypothetical protein